MRIGRRGFLGGMAGTALASLPAWAEAWKGGPAYGVQLYMARELLARNFDSTLAAIAATGVREVEFAGFYDRSAAALRKALADNGLVPIGAHCLRADMADDEAARIIAFCAELGMPYVLAAAPLVPALTLPITSRAQVREAIEKLTLDDIARTADGFNRIARLAARAGLRFAYHTHGLDFRRYGARYGFDEMIARTDPALVDFELDVGNTIAAGADPLPYFRTLGKRLPMVHLKDWRGSYMPVTWDIPPSAVIGEGSVDFPAVVAAMRKAGTRHAFIEQENAPADQMIAAIGTSYRYLSAL